MKWYYVVNARIPNDKAHGIQIASMVEALRARGVDVSVIHPNRTPGGLYARGRWWFVLSTVAFMLAAMTTLARRRLSGERCIVYTVDMDTFSYTLFPLVAPTFAEMHSPKPATLLNRFFFGRVRGIIATTRATKDELKRTFQLPESRCIVEPNGVSVAAFRTVGKAEARTRLALPQGEKLALYVGRLYAWKGVQILPHAFSRIRYITGYIVGGDEKELATHGGIPIPPNLHAAGLRPSEEIPIWLSAADALIVLGTTENDDSMKYTSPMKVFEYMAAGRPIVASRTSALQEVLGPGDAYWYEPDNAASLSEAIVAAVSGRAASLDAERYDWSARAGRIVDFIDHA